MYKILIQPGYTGREMIAAYSVNDLNISYNVNDDFDGVIGSVEWFYDTILKKHIVPNYYPTFLNHLLKRKISLHTEYIIPENDCWVKPSDKYKRFTCTFIKGNSIIPYEPPYYISETIKIINEWRIYVVNGKIVDVCWYIGRDEDKKIYLPKIGIPLNYCGAIDIGELKDGSIELIEAHHPFSIGWYGNDHSKYIDFIVSGWKYLQHI